MTAYGRCAASLRLGDGCQGTPGNLPCAPFHPSIRWAASLGPWGPRDLRWSIPHPTTIHAKTQGCECYSADGPQPSGVCWAKRQKRLQAGNAELHINDPEDLPQTNPSLFALRWHLSFIVYALTGCKCLEILDHLQHLQFQLFKRICR